MKHMSSLILGVLTLAQVATAAPLKEDPMAARGCMQKVSVPEAESVISRFNLHTSNAKPEELVTLGTSLKWMEKLNDGRPLLEVTQEPGGYTYAYSDSHSLSEQRANQIAIHRHGPKNYGQNEAQLVHELGHLFGNRGGYEAYYRATGGKYCVVSRYSSPEAIQPGTIRWHEQFAEVFAAYVTRPTMIKDNPAPACQAAFKFFSTTVFPRSGPLALNCLAHQAAIEKKLSAVLVSNAIAAAPGGVHSSLPPDIAAAEAAKRADLEAKKAAAKAGAKTGKAAAGVTTPSNSGLKSAPTNGKPVAKKPAPQVPALLKAPAKAPKLAYAPVKAT